MSSDRLRFPKDYVFWIQLTTSSEQLRHPNDYFYEQQQFWTTMLMNNFSERVHLMNDYVFWTTKSSEQLRLLDNYFTEQLPFKTTTLLNNYFSE